MKKILASLVMAGFMLSCTVGCGEDKPKASATVKEKESATVKDKDKK